MHLRSKLTTSQPCRITRACPLFASTTPKRPSPLPAPHLRMDKPSMLKKKTGAQCSDVPGMAVPSGACRDFPEHPPAPALLLSKWPTFCLRACFAPILHALPAGHYHAPPAAESVRGPCCLLATHYSLPISHQHHAHRLPPRSTRSLGPRADGDGLQSPRLSHPPARPPAGERPEDSPGRWPRGVAVGRWRARHRGMEYAWPAAWRAVFVFEV